MRRQTIPASIRLLAMTSTRLPQSIKLVCLPFSSNLSNGSSLLHGGYESDSPEEQGGELYN